MCDWNLDKILLQKPYKHSLPSTFMAVASDFQSFCVHLNLCVTIHSQLATRHYCTLVGQLLLNLISFFVRATQTSTGKAQDH